MNELSLFTGAGGGLLGTHHLLGWRTIGMVEIDDYCQKVLRQRQRDGLLDDCPIFGDIRAFIREGYAERYRGMVDVISAGFPCQPFSVAGKKLGADDPRNMWPETIDVIRRVRPRFCLLENTPGLFIGGYLGTVFGDLAEGGYDCRWCCLSGYYFKGPVRRERVFIVAESNGVDGETRMGTFKNRKGALQPGIDKQVFREVWVQTIDRNAGSHNGVADYLDRGRAVGNGQIPAVVATAWEILNAQ